MADASGWKISSRLTNEEALSASGTWSTSWTYCQKLLLGDGSNEKNGNWINWTDYCLQISNDKVNQFNQSVDRVGTVYFSWNERRRVDWAHRPYEGGNVDGPFNGNPPGTWQIFCEKPAFFAEKTYKLPVPHTEEVKTCHHCNGKGRVRCGKCAGKKYIVVKRGEDTDYQTCTQCYGRGNVRCGTCNKQKKLIHYLELTVQYLGIYSTIQYKL